MSEYVGTPEDIDRLKLDLDGLGHKVLRATVLAYRKTTPRTRESGKGADAAVFRATFGLLVHAVALLYVAEWLGGPAESPEERAEVEERAAGLAMRAVEWEAGQWRR